MQPPFEATDMSPEIPSIPNPFASSFDGTIITNIWTVLAVALPVSPSHCLVLACSEVDTGDPSTNKVFRIASPEASTEMSFATEIETPLLNAPTRTLTDTNIFRSSGAWLVLAPT
ncbi:unannotated protein [freshwater metagenome]|uniref:Unannotated protein n=1 Tax=freshwater metagenome TaxID=449393 RepID=A0A6J6RDV8_9ZZZZ